MPGDGISMIAYGPSKGGKSTLGDTTPAPRLVLDAEMGSRFTPSRKKKWDPSREAPPEADGTWDTVLVTVHTYSAVLKAYEWLNSGKHPFNSVVIDSISEVQQRLADSLVGTNPMQLQDWGTMLRQASDLVRKFRDLTTHQIKPLDCVLFIAMAHQRQDGTWHPHVQGQLKTTLPYYTDLLVYLAALPQEDGSVVRRLLIGPTQGYETGERVGGRLGHFMDNPNITDMLRLVREGATGENTKIEVA
jgi:hypothetical protein